MKKIATLSDLERSELFRNTAAKMGVNDAIVEKDFWVCYMLDYLFHRSPWKSSLAFIDIALLPDPVKFKTYPCNRIFSGPGTRRHPYKRF